MKVTRQELAILIKEELAGLLNEVIGLKGSDLATKFMASLVPQQTDILETLRALEDPVETTAFIDHVSNQLGFNIVDNIVLFQDREHQREPVLGSQVAPGATRAQGIPPELQRPSTLQEQVAKAIQKAVKEALQKKK